MQKPTIFIVDDSTMMTQFLSIFFEKKYNVMAYQNPIHAIEDIKKGIYPDVVITDFDMPEISGLDFIKAARQAACHIPVIVVSGMRESKYRLNCLEAGADDFITKPFHPAELDIRIKKQLSLDTPVHQQKPSFIRQMMRSAAIF